MKSIIKKVKSNSKKDIKGHKVNEKITPKTKKIVHKPVTKEKNIPEKSIKKKIVEKQMEIMPQESKTLPILTADMTKISSIKEPINEIKSLKQLEEKILEKFEENKPELKEILEIREAKLPPVEDKILVEKKEIQNPKSIHFTNTEEKPDYKTRIEAILFAHGKYLDEEMISQLCDIDKRHTKKALEELKRDYDERDTALMITQEGNSWKINVREKYVSLVRKIVADTEISKSIMETLAIIAWKTPVYQNEVVRIRGNKCYDHIAELENAGFVTKVKKGRSYVLKTTDKFYNYFDIDQKQLKGIMNEAKLPTTQMKLDEEKVEDVTPYSREKLLHALETIETKSIIQTEEDKLAQKTFLDQMHEKIEAASKRTDEVVAEIPRPMHEQTEEQPVQNTETVAELVPPELKGDSVTEKGEDIVINTDIPNGSEHHFQKPEEQPQRPKQLTKKQLEKKFKEELQRVKEKSETKK